MEWWKRQNISVEDEFFTHFFAKQALHGLERMIAYEIRSHVPGTQFTRNRLMQILTAVGLELGPADDGYIIEHLIDHDPGIFLQNEIQVFEPWDAEADR